MNDDNEELKKLPGFLTPRDYGPLIFKLGYPAMSILAVFLMSQSAMNPVGIAVMLLVAIFGVGSFLGTALVMPREERLFYRRFFRWHQIAYADILKCERSIILPLYYLQFRGARIPFSKLYFAPFAPVDRHSQAVGAVIDFIRAKIANEPTQPLAAVAGYIIKPDKSSTWKRIWDCTLSATMTAATILLMRFVGWPGQNFPLEIPPGQNALYRMHVHFWNFCARSLDWPYNVITVAALLTSICAFRFRSYAVPISAILGAHLGGLTARALFRLW